MRGQDQSGSKNPAWRGGHKYWQAGKHGRDKDGLSWKAQRLLAWERDSYTCQHCGKTKQDIGQRPDCHHVVPFRVSRSHALSNLVSLCRSCHKRADAKEKVLWGGVVFGGRLKSDKPGCSGCKSKRRKLIAGVCNPCNRRIQLVPEAKKLRDSGLSYQAIGKQMQVDHKTIWNWLKNE